jgi:molecular chaperone GrpE
MTEQHADLEGAPAAAQAPASEAPVATVGGLEHDQEQEAAEEATVGGGAEGEEQLLGRLAEAEASRDEYLADLQRLAADFDNYRKRAAREQQAFAARAHERLIAKLLPGGVDHERALDAAEHHEQAKLTEGVALTRSSLVSTLASEGLVEIDADGAFDPHAHEALMTQPAADVEPGQIVQVVQKGYRLGDVVLRPARVIVSATEE